jgi:DNA transposition AAA+ family ATPase
MSGLGENELKRLKDELKEVMDRHGMSQSGLSKSLVMSPAPISQWMSGGYPGDADRVTEAVKSFLRLQRLRSKSPKKTIDFVETSAAVKVFEVCTLCHSDQEIGVVFGDAGRGKTVAVREYAKRNPDVILIEADLGLCAKMLFLELSKKLGLDGIGVTHDIFEDCVNKLRNSGRLLIIDEAENLPYRALELLRRLHDKADIGIVLVGMPRPIANLRGRQGEYAQLYSRVGMVAKLDALSEDDTRLLVDVVLPNSNGLYRVYHNMSNANARTLTKLLNRSTRVAAFHNAEVTGDIIRAAAGTLII